MIMDGPSPRLCKEVARIFDDPFDWVKFETDPDNYRHFLIEIQGSAWSNQRLKIVVTRAVFSRWKCCYVKTIQ
jgi:hypothetical protein